MTKSLEEVEKEIMEELKDQYRCLPCDKLFPSEHYEKEGYCPHCGGEDLEYYTGDLSEDEGNPFDD